METAREFYNRKINPDVMKNQVIHETIIGLLDEYAEIVKNCIKADVSKAKRTVKRSSNAAAYNDGYSRGCEDTLATIAGNKSV